MPSINEIRQNRIKKLGRIEKKGVAPYPAKTKRTHTCREALERFEEISSKREKIFLAGRLMTVREHGGSTFCHVQDGAGRIQAYFKKDELGEKAYKFFLDSFDSGDFIEVGGTLFLTKKGEKTLLVGECRMLAKSLLPLPEKWHGLK
ncbi:MAG: lysine--tRNA ligase, partial [Candidatus Portnoybacteria bacterium CG10_big_fil_rev_8_21_14_0_10_43_39]